MGLQNAMMNALSNKKRTLRILWRKIILILHLLIPFRGNHNIREKHSGIPQPKYYNSWQEVSAINQIFSLFWVNDLSNHLQDDKNFDARYNSFDYDTIVKSYFPTKNSALESINIERTWQDSYWNPKHSNDSNRLEAYRKSDVLFADMMTNTQGIYKIKKVLNNSSVKEKVELFFGELLEGKRDLFCEAQMGKSTIQSLISNDNLFYLDYPELRKVEQKKGKNEVKYINNMTTISGKKFPSYFQIPFAIFAKVKNFARKDETDFICLASVFNETYYKQNKCDIIPSQIFTGLSDDILDRDKWEIAKCHMACVDTNDFTFRTHLGMLHYASSIYTTAFYNLSKTKKDLGWLKTQFVDIFSSGLLQIDFMANLTLIDHDQPMAEKIFHITREQTVNLILDTNLKFNIMQFDPEHLGRDSFESDSITMSRAYYRKIQEYIDFLFWHHRKSWDGKTRQMGKFLFQQLGSKNQRFDGISQLIMNDDTPHSLKKIMTNLAYLWIVHHGETFSLVSVANAFYLVPPMMRKPLSDLVGKKTPLTDAQKQQFLLHKDLIKDSMTLHKVVTYRADSQTIVSRWNDLPVKYDDWKRFLIAKYGQQSDYVTNHYLDFWNDATLNHYKLNYERTSKGLYNLHWLMPHELPISLNI